jgi:dihydrolipoamide dehydrogenase
VQTAHAVHSAHETFAKLGVRVGDPQLDFAAANEWKSAVVDQMTSGVASLFKANGVEWVKGAGRFRDANTIAVEGGEDVTFTSAIVATGSYPILPPIPGLDSPRCVDSTGLLAQTEVPRRLVVLGGGIIGCEFASIFNRFGSEVTVVEMLPTLIPMEDEAAAKELAKAFGKRGITLHLGKQCTQVDDRGDGLVVHFGEGETVECDLMLVSVGRAPLVEGLGLEEAGVQFDKRAGIATDEHRRTSVPHLYAAGDVAGYWQLAHTGFREGEVAAENACDHEATIGDPAVPRPIYTDPEIAGVGLTEAQARERHGENVSVGVFPWVANARAVMSGETTGWVKSIHETSYGELLGVVIVGPHATDLIEAAVVAIDAESTVETVADGIAPHPTLSEAIKEAGLVALGRAIHLPNRKRAPARA